MYNSLRNFEKGYEEFPLNFFIGYTLCLWTFSRFVLASRFLRPMSFQPIEFSLSKFDRLNPMC